MEYSDAGVTKVKILSQPYSIKSDDSPEYVRSLAAYVDQRLSQVARSTPTVDTLKVAILTALNIADELFRAKEADTGREAWYGEKIRECNLLLDELVE